VTAVTREDSSCNLRVKADYRAQGINDEDTES
jgi:hypothetical protein